ncbi:unnamed protein product [Hydatigera taeniaeformis]|uniref:Cwf21 domain-containing protein n=1 Tax=Hydatigena taeniaeformis TaxID=6205 RepID=A0A0R3X3K5_HYDTA|nr:unnamed protein product [Hydatigera taeniaeformis]
MERCKQKQQPFGLVICELVAVRFEGYFNNLSVVHPGLESEHGYIRRNSSADNDSANQEEVLEDSTENDLDDLQSQRALVEAELRRQAKAPPGLKIRDLLACRSIIEDEDDDDEHEGEEGREECTQEKKEVSKPKKVEGNEDLDVSSAQVKTP